jgi:hypothetical protein
MAVEGNEKVETSLRALRRRVDELELRQRDTGDTMRYAVLASALAGVLVALSAATWRTMEDSAGLVNYSHTLWGLAEKSGLAAWTLVGVLVVAVGTVTTFVAENTARSAHAVFVVLCALTVVGAIAIPSPDGFYDPEQLQAGAGWWLTVLAALAVAVVHGHRFAALGKR